MRSIDDRLDHFIGRTTDALIQIALRIYVYYLDQPLTFCICSTLLFINPKLAYLIFLGQEIRANAAEVPCTNNDNITDSYFPLQEQELPILPHCDEPCQLNGLLVTEEG